MIRKTALPALLIALLDLTLKLIPLGENRPLIPGVLGIHSLSNKGVAFGFLAQSPYVNLLLITLLLLSAGTWLHHHPPSGLQAAAAAMMLGGAAGNLIDRFAHGAVSDYLQFLFLEFPVFNLADACVTVGAGILIIDMLFLHEKQKNEHNQQNR